MSSEMPDLPPLIEVTGVRWSHNQLATFLDAIPDGTKVEIKHSAFFDLDDLPVDGWPELVVSITGCYMEALR